ncbi:hypothetical protein D3C81_1514240 [compost metagenome]
MGVFAGLAIEQQAAGDFRVALGKVTRQLAQGEQLFLVIGQQRVEHGAELPAGSALTNAPSLERRQAMAYLPNGLCRCPLLAPQATARGHPTYGAQNNGAHAAAAGVIAYSANGWMLPNTTKVMP